MTTTHLHSDQLVAYTGDGSRVVVWRSEPRGTPRGVVVLAGGFAQRMRHMGAIAAYLVANGALVYRFDPVRHPGLSDGNVGSFSLSALSDSLQAVRELAEKENPGETPVAVASSLAARAAVRLATRGSGFARLVLLVGVVDYRRTLAQALGTDYSTWTIDELPATITIEGQVCDPRAVWLDERDQRWGGAEETVIDLLSVRVPVINFVSVSDEWVDAEQVEGIFRLGAGGERYIVRLPEGQHRISANPVALRTLLRMLTTVALCPQDRIAEVVATQDDLPVIAEPGFDELVTLTVQERARERAEARSSAARSSGAVI